MQHRRRRSGATAGSGRMKRQRKWHKRLCRLCDEFAAGKLANSRPDHKREKNTFYSAARMPRCLESEQIPRQLEELSLRHGGRGTPDIDFSGDCGIFKSSFKSEIATAAFPFGFCDRGVLPSNDVHCSCFLAGVIFL